MSSNIPDVSRLQTSRSVNIPSQQLPAHLAPAKNHPTNPTSMLERLAEIIKKVLLHSNPAGQYSQLY